MLYTVFLAALIIIAFWFIWSYLWHKNQRQLHVQEEIDNTGILKDFLLSDHFTTDREQEVAESLHTPDISDKEVKDEATCRKIINYYRHMNRDDIAEKYLKLLFKKYTVKANDLVLAASFKMNKAAFPDAVALLSHALALEPGNTYALNNRGYARLYTGEYTAAETDLSAAITIEPGGAFPYNNRGYARIMLGNMADAFADIQKSLELDEQNSYAYRNLGIWYARQKEWEKAKKELRKAFAIDPGTPELADYMQLVKENLH